MHRTSAARPAGSAVAELPGSLASADAVRTRGATPRKVAASAGTALPVPRAKGRVTKAATPPNPQAAPAHARGMATPPGVPKTPNSPYCMSKVTATRIRLDWIYFASPCDPKMWVDGYTSPYIRMDLNNGPRIPRRGIQKGARERNLRRLALEEIQKTE